MVTSAFAKFIDDLGDKNHAVQFLSLFFKLIKEGLSFIGGACPAGVLFFDSESFACGPILDRFVFSIGRILIWLVWLRRQIHQIIFILDPILMRYLCLL